MIQLGQKPDFSFSISVIENGEEKNVQFGSLLKGPTVISVHLKNNSPSCDKQNEGLVAVVNEISAFGYNLMALRQDSCASHKKYAAKKSIGYTLVSDPDQLFAKATDSIVEKNMYGKSYSAPARIAVILDANGCVLSVLQDVTAKDFGAEILSRLKTLSS